MAAPKKKPRNPDLAKLEDAVALEAERRRKKNERARRRRARAKAANPAPEGTRVRKQQTTTGRKPPPVPKGKSLKEIKEMDPDDPEFRHRSGRPRKPRKDKKDVGWKESVRQDKQDRANKRRAKARKAEGVSAKAIEILSEEDGRPYQPGATQQRLGATAEDRLIAEGVVDLDDWDDEELARGYRRDRNGRFGSAPSYIPREVQQEAFRRIVKRGERQMQGSYLKAIETLTYLATRAESETVRLNAARELMDRLVGKVPEHLRVSPDAPYQDILADSLVPVSEMPPLDLEPNAAGVLALPGGEDAVVAPDAGGRGAAPPSGSVDAPASSPLSNTPDAPEAPPRAKATPGVRRQVSEDEKAAARRRAATRARRKAASDASKKPKPEPEALKREATRRKRAK